ncbi:hypothetical protein M406DRAFT_354729 [Cryphonectria parasitica EP155]|uniref:Amino acid permease/ SLC12A domain-containing protein n=1 Tax=Cryphonectria parasitica (strain ATCC 38755 / EP155) TaxID=660469 RepID=A0A9P4YE68_CRYP1|nr:uncharacterized protein M406DRAFT_354729 [Cryphonectria parasitica EP155]KAF3771209.1 hypothetical protein M406DRAFT_354729 [Cryphonectria parasitica EP155]
MAGVEGDVARPQLRQQFTSFQILCIVLSGLIGTGVFVTNADALQLAGPGGLLLCLCLLSIITIGVSETVSHLVQLFPAPNAIFEYVSTFVDRELAWVVGLAYWYAWTSVFATEMLTAATIIRYWKASPFLTSIISYVVIPIILVFINTRHVQVFGWIEAIGGVLKVFLMTTLTIAIYHAADSSWLSPLPSFSQHIVALLTLIKIMMEATKDQSMSGSPRINSTQTTSALPSVWHCPSSRGVSVASKVQPWQLLRHGLYAGKA